ncbi:MAG: hypothetical protein OSB13_03465 [Porticoccaceae bacterium]|nr:hypothetical protein [Porticoccaceae bacterium]
MTVAKNYQTFLLKPSKIQFYASLILMMTAAILLVILSIVFWLKVIAIAGIMIFLVRIIALWRNAESQILRFNPETDCWQLSGPQGLQELRLKPDQFVTARLVIMHFETSHKSVIRCFITRDVVNAADHHRLRALLMARSH